MADAKKCDRCGAYYEEIDDAHPIYRISKYVDPTRGYKILDLCHNCTYDLFGFMEEHKEESES